MGEIADDMVNGFCCSLCGVYFENENGFPVLCVSCAKGHSFDSNGLSREGWQRSLEKEL